MPDRDHADAVDLLRAALWEPEDEAARRALAHAAGCPSCGGEQDAVRRARDAVRAGGEGPSDSVEASVRRTLACGTDLDLTWLAATAAGPLAGVRSADGSGMVRCDDGDLRLDACLHPTGEPGRFSVSGQVLLDGREPGVDLEVTLFLDRRPAGAVRTDGFGEFLFDAGALRGRRARQVGVRVAGRGSARHVELWRAPEETR